MPSGSHQMKIAWTTYNKQFSIAATTIKCENFSPCLHHFDIASKSGQLSIVSFSVRRCCCYCCCCRCCLVLLLVLFLFFFYFIFAAQSISLNATHIWRESSESFDWIRVSFVTISIQMYTIPEDDYDSGIKCAMLANDMGNISESTKEKSAMHLVKDIDKITRMSGTEIAGGFVHFWDYSEFQVIKIELNVPSWIQRMATRPKYTTNSTETTSYCWCCSGWWL